MCLTACIDAYGPINTTGMSHPKAFELKRAVIEEETDCVKLIYIRHGILFGDQTKEDEMRGAKGTYEGQEKCIQVFDGEI